MNSGSERDSLVSVFVTEAMEGVASMTSALYPADGGLPAVLPLAEQYITAHRIRGAAASYGYAGVARVAERLETLLEHAPETPPAQWPQTVDVMRDLAQRIGTLVQAIGKGSGEDRGLVEESLALLKKLSSVPELSTSTSSDVAEGGAIVLPELDPEILEYFIPEAQEYLSAIEGLIGTLRDNRTDADAIYRLFRAAHTLKGSAYTIGFQVVGDVACPMEDCMIAVRENRISFSDDVLAAMAQGTDTIRLLLRRDPTAVPQLHQDVPSSIHRLRSLYENRSEVLAAAPPSAETTVPQPAPHASALSQDRLKANDEKDLLSAFPDEYLVPNLDAEVLSYFAPEAQEYLERLEADLLRLEKDPQNKELINQLFRTAHTLKGSAYTVGFQSIGDLTHHVEDFMGMVRDGQLTVLPGHTDLMLRSIDVVRVLMRRDIRTVTTLRQRFDAARSELKQLSQATMGSSQTLDVNTISEAAPVHDMGSDGQPMPVAAGEGKSAEDREVIRVSHARLEQLMNLVGELVIGRGRLEQRLRVLEQLSQQVLNFRTRLVDSVQSFSDKHTFTFQEAPSTSTAATGGGFPGLGDFGALELDKYDDFNILARRISEVTADISESMSQLNGSIRRAHDDMSQLQQLTLSMRDEIARARMVPIGTPFTRFRRAIREVARASGKEAALVTSGEHTEVDTGVVERLVDPLVHLVRNAVYHGIEFSAERVAKGKPAAGTIYLHAAHRGNSVIIEIEDDGAGLDVGKIRAKAIKSGLIRPDQLQSLSDVQTRQLIFLPGFSTAEQVGDQAGRGVGLDVVKRVIESMNGQIEVESEPGVGTKFTLHLPVTLLIATALIVRTGTERYAIPLQSIREVTMPMASSLWQEEGRTILQLSDEKIEVQGLQSMLRRELGQVHEAMPVVVVRTGAGPIGLAVDELLGRQEIVIKHLGLLRVFERSVFGGATIDPEGRVILVVDPSRLVAKESQDTALVTALATTPVDGDGVSLQDTAPSDQQETRLLLIDDSLSIRKFVGRMLESAGYQLDTAVDGEDGLRKAAAGNYRLIITDLEMPKLNGFEVVQALRSHPHTRQTPVMVMTTRAGDKHRQMAMSIGANAYIAKPVEEWILLQEVERWVGRSQPLRA